MYAGELTLMLRIYLAELNIINAVQAPGLLSDQIKEIWYAVVGTLSFLSMKF